MAEVGEAHAPENGAAMLTRAQSERRVEFVQAVMNRAQVLFRSGQLDSADVLLETVQQEPLARARVLHIRGVIALYRGEDETALDLLEEAIRLDPADGEAHANLGVLLLKAQQYPQALAAFASALTLLPGNVAAQFGLARALASLDLPDLAADALRDVLVLAPDHAEAAADLASLLDGRGHDGVTLSDTGKGADPITASAMRMTAAPRAGSATICDALFVDACRHHREGNSERARGLFERVLALDPCHVNTLCNLGALELDGGHAGRAQTLLRSAVALAPQLAPLRVTFADALMACGKVEQAHAEYRRALQLAPSSDAVHAQYALVLRDSGDLDGAMTHFLAATKINQQQSSHFYEALGRTCAARGNPEGAEISLRHAAALEPRRVSAHCALGELYLALDRRADAEASFRQALAVDADHAAARRGIEQARDSVVREGIA